MIKKVYLIFKTHLDLGYTDLAQNVMKNYLENYIPGAIKVGYQLKDTKTPFIWTLGSWMVWEALRKDKDGSLEKAIKDGIIAWHALPFTSHTEIMSAKLFNYGLSLSQKLDERFGKKTIGAKMTDVPGHTIGSVPLMADAGIKFLHLGINTASPEADVPALFRWRYNDKEIIVMYQGSYGEAQEFDDFAICFAHTNDNLGPQSPEEVVNIYEKISKKYPDAQIVAATLDDVAKRVGEIKDLPVITEEIGDTWIYGTGSDPKKVSGYLALLRYIEDKDIESFDLTDNLLAIPEHTWGAATMHFLPDILTWTAKELEARSADADIVMMEKAWQEQRDYVTAAEKVLGVSAYDPILPPSLDGFTRKEPQSAPFSLSWQLFDYFVDNKRYIEKYMRLTQENYWWALWDYTKFGLANHWKGMLLEAEISEYYEKGDERIYKLVFPEDITKTYGLPVFYAIEKNGNFEFRWFGKEKSRLPQAFFVKFNGLREDWRINKMGTFVDPRTARGSKLIHGTTECVSNGEVEIKALDSTLVLPFGRRLYDYETSSDINYDLYFCLYNNQYNTNFPLWYSDDSRFRFEFKKL